MDHDVRITEWSALNPAASRSPSHVSTLPAARTGASNYNKHLQRRVSITWQNLIHFYFEFNPHFHYCCGDKWYHACLFPPRMNEDKPNYVGMRTLYPMLWIVISHIMWGCKPLPPCSNCSNKSCEDMCHCALSPLWWMVISHIMLGYMYILHLGFIDYMLCCTLFSVAYMMNSEMSNQTVQFGPFFLW